MPEVSQAVLDDIYAQVGDLRRQVERLRMNAAPTVPIYSEGNFPPDGVEGQIVLTSEGNAWKYQNGVWSPIGGAGTDVDPYIPLDGWIHSTDTFTVSSQINSSVFDGGINGYAYILSPTTFTDTLEPGYKIRISSAYFIITKILSGGDLLVWSGSTPGSGSTLTVSSTYSTLSYSRIHVPQGFPIHRERWQITSIGSAGYSTPTVNTWYDMGVLTPLLVGDWLLDYAAGVEIVGASPGLDYNLLVGIQGPATDGNDVTWIYHPLLEYDDSGTTRWIVHTVRGTVAMSNIYVNSNVGFPNFINARLQMIAETSGPASFASGRNFSLGTGQQVTSRLTARCAYI